MYQTDSINFSSFALSACQNIIGFTGYLHDQDGEVTGTPSESKAYQHAKRIKEHFASKGLALSSYQIQLALDHECFLPICKGIVDDLDLDLEMVVMMPQGCCPRTETVKAVEHYRKMWALIEELNQEVDNRVIAALGPLMEVWQNECDKRALGGSAKAASDRIIAKALADGVKGFTFPEGFTIAVEPLSGWKKGAAKALEHRTYSTIAASRPVVEGAREHAASELFTILSDTAHNAYPITRGIDELANYCDTQLCPAVSDGLIKKCHLSMRRTRGRYATAPLLERQIVRYQVARLIDAGFQGEFGSEVFDPAEVVLASLELPPDESISKGDKVMVLSEFFTGLAQYEAGI